MLGLYTFPGSMVSGGAGDAFFVPFYNLAVFSFNDLQEFIHNHILSHTYLNDL